jgi:hypothetical protein
MKTLDKKQIVDAFNERIHRLTKESIETTDLYKKIELASRISEVKVWKQIILEGMVDINLVHFYR